MLTTNWREKTLFRLLVLMKDNPIELVASNQQNQNQNSGQNYGTLNVVKFSILNIQYSITKIQHSVIANSIFNIKFKNSTRIRYLTKIWFFIDNSISSEKKTLFDDQIQHLIEKPKFNGNSIF